MSISIIKSINAKITNHFHSSFTLVSFFIVLKASEIELLIVTLSRLEKFWYTKMLSSLL